MRNYSMPNLSQKQFMPLAFSSFVAARAKFVMACTSYSPLQDDIREAVAACEEEYVDVTAAMRAMHRLQRLYVVHQMGLEENAALTEALRDETRFPLWDSYAAVPMTEDQRDHVAQLMFE